MNSKMKPKLEYHKTIEPRRKDSFWFDGHVATLSNDKATVNIIAMGHVSVSFKANGEQYANDMARKEARTMGYTDQKLKNLNRHDGWANNNWYAFEVVVNGQTYWDDATDVYLPDAINTAKEILKEK